MKNITNNAREGKGKPKLFVDLSGGLVQQIISDTDIDVIVVDFDDIETGGNGKVVQIDGMKAYVFAGIEVDVDKTFVEKAFRQIGKGD